MGSDEKLGALAARPTFLGAIMAWVEEWRPLQVGHEFSSCMRMDEGLGGRGSIMFPQEEREPGAGDRSELS